MRTSSSAPDAHGPLGVLVRVRDNVIVLAPFVQLSCNAGGAQGQKGRALRLVSCYDSLLYKQQDPAADP